MEEAITKTVKHAIMTALSSLTPTSDGTVIKDVVGSGEDAFDKYPIIRVLPNGITRDIDSTERHYKYTMNYVISIYLELGNDVTLPDEEVIDTLLELQDKVYKELDEGAWLPDVGTGNLDIVENTSPSIIDTTNSKTGVAVYCDIEYGVTLTKPI